MCADTIIEMLIIWIHRYSGMRREKIFTSVVEKIFVEVGSGVGRGRSSVATLIWSRSLA